MDDPLPASTEMMPVIAVICRILMDSETKMFPSLSTAILVGSESLAVIAAIPLTVSSLPPATVVMMPVIELIFFTTPPFSVTVMYMFPAVSNAMPDGDIKYALVARMLSENTPVGNPPPATVVIMPVLIVIFLTLPFVLSAM